MNIFSPWEQRVIAQCQGHSSFLSSLAFDDLTAVAFLPRWLPTGTKVGHVKLWIRPLPVTSWNNGHTLRTAADAQDVDWVS